MNSIFCFLSFCANKVSEHVLPRWPISSAWYKKRKEEEEDNRICRQSMKVENVSRPSWKKRREETQLFHSLGIRSGWIQIGKMPRLWDVFHSFLPYLCHLYPSSKWFTSLFVMNANSVWVLSPSSWSSSSISIWTKTKLKKTPNFNFFSCNCRDLLITYRVFPQFPTWVSLTSQ